MQQHDNDLKPIIENSWSYIRDSSDLINKINRVENTQENAMLVNADVGGLYSS